MEGWATSKNLNVCASLATCGVDFSFERILDEPTGRTWTKFFFALKSKHPPGDPLHFSTPGMLKRIRAHEIEQNEPAHHVVDGLHGCNTREHLLNWIKRGERCRILPIAGASRAVTVAGTEATPPSAEVIRTDDMKLAAALMRCGLPCVGIEGTAESYKFLIRTRGLFPEVDGVKIAKDLRSGKLARDDEEHPALWVYMTLRNRDAILKMVKENAEMVLLRNPRSAGWQTFCRSAVIYPNSSTKALDQAQAILKR